MTHKLGLLNTTIATTDGTYTIRTISLNDAKLLVRAAGSTYGLDSAIGHQSTADVMSVLLETAIEVNRQTFAQQAGQLCLVFKLNGRAPEGKILSVEEIEQMGYEFKLMERVD